MDSSLSFEIALVVVSIFLSGYFSATETALTSLSELKIKHAIKEQGDSLKSLELWIHHPNKVLNTILFGNNLVNILASIMASEIISELSGNSAVAVTTGIMTFIILFFGEITPKTFAKKNALKFASVSIKFLKVLFYILLPITWLMNVVVMFLLKITNQDNANSQKISEDELEFLINIGEQEGVLENGKGEMLSNIFDMSDIQVREVMVPRIDISAISSDTTMEELVEFVYESEHSRIPLYEDSPDKIIGILYVKDVMKLINKQASLDEILASAREALFVPETKKVDIMLKEFQKLRSHMAVVIDEYGGTAGIVTMEDILEEIVGDILDEYDIDDTKDYEKISDDIYLIDSRMNIDDFCDEFDIEKTDDMEEYETVGGLVFDIAGDIPNVGDSYEWRELKITVKEMNGRRIEKIELNKLSETELTKTETETIEEGTNEQPN